MNSARTAAADDAHAVASLLARAFLDDPLMLHVLPQQKERAQKLARMFALLFRSALPYRGCFVTAGAEAAAMWRPPGAWKAPVWQYAANAPALLGLFRADIVRVLGIIDEIEEVHPAEPHWYLQTVGTEPAHQGKGFGGSVIRAGLARADAENVPCYLETSKESNIAIYRAFGFTLTREIELRNGPPLWLMWREARSRLTNSG